MSTHLVGGSELPSEHFPAILAKAHDLYLNLGYEAAAPVDRSKGVILFVNE